MYEINRSVATLRPNLPFMTWLQSLPGGLDPAVSLSELRQSSNAVLIPPFDDAMDARAFIAEHYLELFQAELADWCEDPNLWPRIMTVTLFTDWFDIDIHLIANDIVDGPLDREPFVPFDLDPQD